MNIRFRPFVYHYKTYVNVEIFQLFMDKYVNEKTTIPMSGEDFQ